MIKISRSKFGEITWFILGEKWDIYNVVQPIMLVEHCCASSLCLGNKREAGYELYMFRR